MIDPETVLNAFHDPAYVFQSELGTVHRVEGGRVLCGIKTWLYGCPRELVADRFPDHVCGNCRRVQLARQPKQTHNDKRR